MISPSQVPSPVVDAHLHLWDLTVGDYAWLPEGTPLHATITAERAQAELAGAGIGRAVLVQAEDSEVDTEFMLAQAKAHDWIAGVVGWIQLDDPARAAAQLDRWRADKSFKGVRHLVHDDPRDDFLALPGVRRTLTALAEQGVPFDVPDAWPRHLHHTVTLAQALPELTIVLDHLGKPPRDNAERTRWREPFRALGRCPNAVAKVSGLPVPGTEFTADAIRPAWEAALQDFGPSRLMYGGDWPLPLLAGSRYQQVWEVVSGLIDELSADERADVRWRTASRVYGLAGAIR